MPEAPSTRISISGLVKKYHYQSVLSDLNLTIGDGDFCVLVGANGAGKTTLLRILASLVHADAGEIILGNDNLGVTPQTRSKIGFVSHHPMFYQDLTAVENLNHYARLYHIDHIDEAVKQGIRAAGLEKHQHKPVRVFSRGMQQRLSISRALLHHPTILLFDEPYAGLDQAAACFLDRELQALHVSGRAILLAAHRPQRLLSIASHIAWLRDGKIVQHLPVERLSESPELEDYLREVA